MAKSGRRSKTTLWTNVAVFVGFVVAVILGFDTVEAGGGWVFAAHALLASALLGGLAFHVLLHWKWIVSAGRRFFRGLKTGSRVRFVVDLLTGALFALLLVSGVVIWLTGARSHTGGVDGDPWLLAHHASNKLLIPLVATHLVLNRRWIAEDLLARSRRAPAAPAEDQAAASERTDSQHRAA